MKAYIYKWMQVSAMIAMTVLLANCGKSDSNNNTTNTNSGYTVTNNQCYLNGAVQSALSACQPATTIYYGYVGTTCYQVGNNTYQAVATTMCTTTTTNGAGYYTQNGLCYQNGVQVNYTLCQNSSSLCNGYYLGMSSSGGYAVALCTEGATGTTYQNNVQTPFGFATTVTVMDCSGLTLQNSYGTQQTCQ